MKVDMVYLWCDGEDPEFKRRRQMYCVGGKTESINEEVTGAKRFFDNDELRYSLRSLEKNANWINHVYIVTDRQVPKWLNLDYEKVTIVDHSEIMPQEIIPCFNSAVIEYFLPYIKNLSEKFLYGCDDMFFGRQVDIKHFFTEKGIPIVRVKKFKDSFHFENCSKQYSYISTVCNSLDVINAKYNKREYFELHHNIDVYTKSGYLDALHRYDHLLKKCYNNKFRNVDDLERTLISLDMVYSGNAKMKIISNPKPWRRVLNSIFPVYWESYVDEASEKSFNEIIKYKPLLFCLNSNDNCDFEHKRQIVKFMEELFPIPSKFEK